jgi:hypothetical protein
MSDDAHPDVCNDDGCPRARTAVDPKPVATAPRPERVVAVVPRSVVRWRRLPDPEGERRRGPVRASDGDPGAPRRARGGGAPKTGEQAAPPDVRVATSPHETRGSSGVAEGARCARGRAWHLPIRRSSGGPSDDLHPFLCPQHRPPATTCSDSCYVFRLLCFMLTKCSIYAKTFTILCLNTEFVYQFIACIFFACTL